MLAILRVGKLLLIFTWYQYIVMEMSFLIQWLVYLLLDWVWTLRFADALLLYWVIRLANVVFGSPLAAWS
jgi:hypothetical protein